MAGKRPDQHNIAPGEAGASDYKNLPQVGKGHSSLDDTIELDRQRLAKSREKERDQGIDEARPGAADTNPGKENPLV